MPGVVPRYDSPTTSVCSWSTEDNEGALGGEAFTLHFYRKRYIVAASRGAARDVPKAVSVVISNRSVARRRGAYAWNVSPGFVVRESAADYFMRLGGGGTVCGLATRCALAAPILPFS